MWAAECEATVDNWEASGGSKSSRWKWTVVLLLLYLWWIVIGWLSQLLNYKWDGTLCRPSYVTRPSHLTVLGIHWKRTCVTVRPGSASPRAPLWRFIVNCAFLKCLFIIIIIIIITTISKTGYSVHWAVAVVSQKVKRWKEHICSDVIYLVM